MEISGTAFARDCIESDGRVYLFFPKENVQEDRIIAFLEHILDWESPAADRIITKKGL